MRRTCKWEENREIKQIVTGCNEKKNRRICIARKEPSPFRFNFITNTLFGSFDCLEPHNFLKSLLNQVICSGPLLLSPFHESCSQNSLFCSAPRLPLAVGTFKCRGDDAKQAVLWALQSGYRHIGTIHPFLSSTHSTHATTPTDCVSASCAAPLGIIAEVVEYGSSPLDFP